MQSNIFSQKSGGHTWDFTIAGIVKGKAEHVDTNFFLFQYNYFDETRSFGKDTIGWMILQTTAPENNDRVAKAIDAMFANSTAETSTDTEKAFGKAFAAQFGNIALIVSLVVGAAFVTILMIVGNTMALSIRERTREIGVLKTLGFSGPRILGMVLGESVLLALLGGLPGLAIAALIAYRAAQQPVQHRAGVLPCRLTSRCRASALMIALGLITGMIPARQRHAAEDRHRARTRLGTMGSLWRQVVAVTTINLMSISQRRWLSLSTVIAIALVVVVLLAFLAMANGFQRTIAGSGADDIAIVLRAGSQAEINIDRQPRPGAADRGRAGHRAGQRRQAADRRPNSISWSTASSAPPRRRPTCRCAASARRAPRCARAWRSAQGRMFSAAATRSWSARRCCASSRASTSAAPWRSAPRAGPWSACSMPAAACSSRRSGRTCRWCRACSTATTSSRRCARG